MNTRYQYHWRRQSKALWTWKTPNDPCTEPGDAEKKDENTKNDADRENNEDIMPITGRSPSYIEDGADAILADAKDLRRHSWQNLTIYGRWRQKTKRVLLKDYLKSNCIKNEYVTIRISKIEVRKSCQTAEDIWDLWDVKDDTHDALVSNLKTYRQDPDNNNSA